MSEDEPRVSRWASRADWPLTAMALLFLAAYAVPILDTRLSARWDHFYDFVTWLSWAAFAVDYLARLSLSRRRLAFVRGNLFDLATVVLPMLRPLRVLRLLALVSILGRRSGASLRGRVGVYVTGSMVLLLFVGSLTVLDAERNAPGSNIHSFGEAAWWAIVTISTVGYGDFYPVTTTGRLVGAGMMVAGIALLGVVTGSVATWFIDKVRESDTATQAATRHDIAQLSAKIDALQEALSRRDGSASE